MGTAEDRSLQVPPCVVLFEAIFLEILLFDSFLPLGLNRTPDHQVFCQKMFLFF